MHRGPHSTEQMIALHGLFAEGAARGELALSEQSGCEVEVEVVEVRRLPLDGFGERGLRVGDDLVAAVLGRLEGGLPGALALALEPEEALAWVRTGGAGEKVEAFVDKARALLEGLTLAVGEILRAKTAFQDARLVEATEPCLLAGTHAPSDTVVVSAHLRIEVRDESLSAVAHLLLEPKYFARLLSALSAAVH